VTTAGSIEDRATGALLGLAVGDAVGTTLEFTIRDTQPPLTDMVGGGPFDLQPGQWTDDTAMALALGYSLVEEGAFDPHDCMARFSDWFLRGTYSCTGTCFDIGMATRAALGQFRSDGNPFAGSSAPHTAGNGSLMRLSPVPIWAARRGEDIVADLARQQSCLTHAAQECQAACEGFALLTARAILDSSRDEVLAPFAFDGPPRVAEIFAGSWHEKPREQIKSSGYVVHSLEAALWSVGNSSSFEEAILLAANLGDDADTVAAITGQLAGALYGASGIPGHWRDRLAWHDEIETLALDLLGEG